MHIFFSTSDPELKTLYKNHEHFHEGDSGFDLYMPETVVIPKNSTKIISTNVILKMKDDIRDLNYISYFLMPRSSLAKTSFRQANSVALIDAGYNGTLGVAIDNISNEDKVIEKHTRLFQVCSPNLKSFKSVNFVERFEETSRGTGGFGSTGK